jgi:hypothetical protein
MGFYFVLDGKTVLLGTQLSSTQSGSLFSKSFFLKLVINRDQDTFATFEFFIDLIDFCLITIIILQVAISSLPINWLRGNHLLGKEKFEFESTSNNRPLIIFLMVQFT